MTKLTPQQHLLINEHIPLAQKAASKYKRHALSLETAEDIQSAAYLGLCFAAQYFDPAKGTYEKYAIRCCYKEMLKVVMDDFTIHIKQGSRSNSRSEKTLAARETVWNIRFKQLSPLLATYEQPPDLIIKKEDQDRLHAGIQSLPDKEHRVIKYFLEGMTDDKIAAKLGCSDRYVWTLRHRAQKKLHRLCKFGEWRHG